MNWLAGTELLSFSEHCNRPGNANLNCEDGHFKIMLAVSLPVRPNHDIHRLKVKTWRLSVD